MSPSTLATTRSERTDNPWTSMVFAIGVIIALAGMGSQFDYGTAPGLLVKNPNAEVHYTVATLHPAINPDTLATASSVLAVEELGVPRWTILCVGGPSSKTGTVPCLPNWKDEKLSEEVAYKIGFVKVEHRWLAEGGKVKLGESKVLVDVVSPTGRVFLKHKSVIESAIFMRQTMPRWMYGIGAFFVLTSIGMKVRERRKYRLAVIENQ